MAAGPYSIDPTTYLDELLAQASPDLMREMLQGFINQILSTQADQVCGGRLRHRLPGPGEHPQRVPP
ncbi:transposase [Corynebacterium efficiens YS-314]|uniref:Transposase n=1 Tax=Corynebacterium efficiens (strain DSM 44549 / YS-314 / AJ 12310 / JCM 11189 / NBRC 100395) TaxID=196164 RepID=Q8FP40_COREF|nr:transposase [Corynebacterium efficiens YS-314]